MSRKDELMNIIPEDSVLLVKDVIDRIVYLEDKLNELEKLPFIEVNPNNPAQQRNTIASRMYKEFLQQYLNCIKTIEAVVYRDKRLESAEVEDSPLRKWFKENANK